MIKPYNLISWFVVLNTSLEGPKIRIKSAQVYPEHPSTSYMGAEADDCQLLGFINGRTEGNILIKKALHSTNELISHYRIT